MDHEVTPEPTSLAGRFGTAQLELTELVGQNHDVFSSEPGHTIWYNTTSSQSLEKW